MARLRESGNQELEDRFKRSLELKVSHSTKIPLISPTAFLSNIFIVGVTLLNQRAIK